MNDGLEPAFPVPEYGENGMNLRDYFAGQLLARTDSSNWSKWDDSTAKVLAKWAYDVADAMIEARKPKEKSK